VGGIGGSHFGATAVSRLMLSVSATDISGFPTSGNSQLRMMLAPPPNDKPLLSH
jgi:hypothetical protein